MWDVSEANMNVFAVWGGGFYYKDDTASASWEATGFLRGIVFQNKPAKPSSSHVSTECKGSGEKGCQSIILSYIHRVSRITYLSRITYPSSSHVSTECQELPIHRPLKNQEL